MFAVSCGIWQTAPRSFAKFAAENSVGPMTRRGSINLTRKPCLVRAWQAYGWSSRRHTHMANAGAFRVFICVYSIRKIAPVEKITLLLFCCLLGHQHCRSNETLFLSSVHTARGHGQCVPSYTRDLQYTDLVRKRDHSLIAHIFKTHVLSTFVSWTQLILRSLTL